MSRRGLEGMRQILRTSMRTSLHALDAADRLAAAWTVACGPAMAERGEVVGFVSGTLHVDVRDAAWLSQMSTMRSVLAHEISHIAGIEVTAIHFELKKRGESIE